MQMVTRDDEQLVHALSKDQCVGKAMDQDTPKGAPYPRVHLGRGRRGGSGSANGDEETIAELRLLVLVPCSGLGYLDLCRR